MSEFVGLTFEEVRLIIKNNIKITDPRSCTKGSSA